MDRMTLLKVLTGIVITIVAALAGAISMGTTAVVIAGGLYFLGFVTMGTAQAIFIGVVGVGAVVGFLFGLFQAAVIAFSP